MDLYSAVTIASHTTQMLRVISWTRSLSSFRPEHELGRPLPEKFRLPVCWVDGSAIVGMQVDENGKRTHRIWQPFVPSMEEAEVVYFVGHDAVAADKESLRECASRGCSDGGQRGHLH